MIIITGGAGFIGSCLLKGLNDMGIFDILVVDTLRNADKWKNLLNKKFTHYENKNIFRSNLNNKPELYSNCKAIFHLGACSKTTEKDADYLFDNNYNYSKELANFAYNNNIRFIYASSAATYGDGSNGYSDDIFSPLTPLNCYGFTKHIFDLWVLEKGFDKLFTGLKFFNVFGPNEYHKESMSSMVYKSFYQVKDKGEIRLFKSYTPDYSDGGQMRDFIYVKDVVEVMLRIFTKNDFSGIYNLGTGVPRSWNDLAKAVFKSMGKPENIKYTEMPDNLLNQYQNFTAAEMSKLKNNGIDFTFTTLEEAVNDYVNSFLVKNNSGMYL